MAEPGGAGQGSRVTFVAYRGAAAIAQALPDALGRAIARGAARVKALFAVNERKRVLRNQARVRGPLRGRDAWRAVFETYDSYGRYWQELFRLPLDAKHSLEDRFEADGFEHIADAIAAGSGVILVLPHVGGWEFAGAWLAARGYPPTVVVERVDPPELFDWFVEVRAAMGMDVVALDADAGATVARALRDNRVVCLLADRDLTGDGVEVSFFGEKTTLPAGPATLALRTGAPLVPVAVYFRPRGDHLARIGPPLPCERGGRLRDDVARITQDLAHRFEELIRAAPEQWHLMQANWPGDRLADEARDRS
ncbi:MAG TPA: phosphatidylinositol mannoside acyltransferase [Acidimicrobiia bacterium]|nr:phosphatidylinositol mannoside acyltransferase [Acidimicrobiia bacterium]